MSIKQFFSAHAKQFPASMVPAKTEKAKDGDFAKEHYHIDILVPESIEDPMPMPMKKERSPLNLWAPWAAKVEAARAHAEFTE